MVHNLLAYSNTIQVDTVGTEEGIQHQHTEPNEPYQNGVAEKANQDIAVGATAMLIKAKLPPSFWDLAVSTYIHVSNCTPTSALNGSIPYVVWKKKKPDVSDFHVFGGLAYVLVHKEKRKPFTSHTRKGIFVGYGDGVKGWKFWNLVGRKIIISSHAVFDERCFPCEAQIIEHLKNGL